MRASWWHGGPVALLGTYGHEVAPLANQGGEEWGWVVRAGYMAQGGQSS